jgi:CMP/dCMP kinase
MPHITISGDIGSGKSSVAQGLSRAFGYRLASVGQLQRTMAATSGLTTLEANRLAEEVPQLDDLIDEEIVELGRGSTQTIFDSRMAWHLVPSAFKVHLIVDPAVAASRIYRHRVSRTESYGSPADAEAAAEDRFRSERKRFAARFGVDISQLRNYDLVIDTSDVSLDAVATEIRAAFSGCSNGSPSLRVSQRQVSNLPGPLSWSSPAGGTTNHPVIGYLRPKLYLLRPGTKAVDAQPNGLMPAVLGAEGEELAECLFPGSAFAAS